MKFTTPFVLVAAMVASAFAQSANIAVPSSGATVTAGSNITVEIDVPTPATPFQDVAIAIGVTMCGEFTCGDPKEFMQFLLYSGPFDPERDPEERTKPAHQNFTVTLPNKTGPAQMGLVHFSLGREAIGWNSIFNSNSINLTLVA